MIQSKQDLKYYLTEDLKRFNNKKPALNYTMKCGSFMHI